MNELWRTFDEYSRTWLPPSVLKGFLALVAYELDESLRADAEVRRAAGEYVGGISHKVDKAAMAQRNDPLLGDNPVELRLSPFLANVKTSGVVYPDPRLAGLTLQLKRNFFGEVERVADALEVRSVQPDRVRTLPEQATALAYEYMLEVHERQPGDGSVS